MMNYTLPISTRTRGKTDVFYKKHHEENKKKRVRKDNDGIDPNWVNPDCSSLKLRPEGDEGIVYINVDDENGLSGEDVNESGCSSSDVSNRNDKMISSLLRNVESNCSNCDDSSRSVDCRSQSRSGFLKKNEDEDDCDYGASNDSDGLKRIDNGDGDENVVSDRLRRNEDEDEVGGVDAGSGNLDSLETSLELSFSEEYSEDEDYEAENLESYSDFQLSDSEKEEDDEESKGVEKGSRKSGRPKRVGTGFKRRKYGLDMLVDSDDGKNGSVNGNQGYNSVAQRTRSHSTSKLGERKRNLGTFSHPLSVDDFGDETNHVEKKNMSSGGKFESNQGKIEEWVHKAHMKDEGKLRMPPKGKCTRWAKGCDITKILVDSILEKAEVPLEEWTSFRDGGCKEGSNLPVAKMDLPLKFNFGVEESEPSKKSKDEIEMDELWAQLDLAFRVGEIGSFDSAKVEDEVALPAEDDVNGGIRCHLGKHQLILDEEVGLICAFCSFVEREIKHILPDFSTHPCGKSGRRDLGGEMKHSIIDELSQDSICGSHFDCDSRLHAGATVWDIIPEIKSSLYPHQRDGFEFLWKNIAGGIYLDRLKHQTSFSGGSGCIISHAPGTGKTRLTIIFLQSYLKLNPTCRPIIVAPCSMLLTWEEEFRKWKYDIPFHNLKNLVLSGKESCLDDSIITQVGRRNKNDIRILKLCSWTKERSILGISYQMFVKLTGEGEDRQHAALIRKILLERPGLVVLDEGHKARNTGTRILRALSNIKTEKRIILSGTPFQNNFDELYNVLVLARPEFSNKRHKWESLTSSITKSSDERLRCEKVKKVREMFEPFVHVYEGSILQEKIPDLRDSVVILQPSELQKSLFHELSRYMTRHDFNFEYWESLISVHPSLSLKHSKAEFPSDREKLKGLNPEAGVKLKFLMELIRLSEAMNEKVLVFSQYLLSLDLVRDQLKCHLNLTEGNEVLYMDGKDDMKQRQSAINVFNDPTSEARVLLASTKACSEGINLTGASRVVLLDVVWNPSVERQAICRAHRLGQEKVVYIYHLIVSGTKEEEKYQRQVEKDLLSELVFSSSNRSSEQQKISPSGLQDKILEEMVQHEELKYMFEKICMPRKVLG